MKVKKIQVVGVWVRDHAKQIESRVLIITVFAVSLGLLLGGERKRPKSAGGDKLGEDLPIKCAPEGLREKATVSGKGKGFALGLGFYCLFKQFLLKYS